MLSLLVQEGDYVLIGDNIRIHIQKGIGRNMKIGIDAPRSVPVVRGELYEKLLMENALGNIDELEQNRHVKENFKKDTERFNKKREGVLNDLKRKGAVPASAR